MCFLLSGLAQTLKHNSLDFSLSAPSNFFPFLIWMALKGFEKAFIGIPKFFLFPRIVFLIFADWKPHSIPTKYFQHIPEHPPNTPPEHTPNPEHEDDTQMM